MQVADPSSNAQHTLRRQIWLAALTAALMACGMALALRALTVESSLHERYSSALALAQQSLEAQQLGADLRRWHGRFASLAAQEAPGSQATASAFQATQHLRDTMAAKIGALRQLGSSPDAMAQVDRIEQALATLGRINTANHEALRARTIAPQQARAELLNQADAQFSVIDDAFAALVAATRASTEEAAQQARHYGALARYSLIAVSAIAVALGALLGVVSWRATRANVRLLERLNQIAHEDGLTGAMNRRALDERLPVELARAARIAYPLTVVMIDFDHFKRFNDKRGHPAGDRLLRGAVQAWRTHLRPMDMLARYGGEEFTLVLPACDAEQASLLIGRLRPLVPERQTFSAGVAKWNGFDSPEELLRGADAALLQAKKAGRNRTVVWGNEPQITLPLRMS